MSLGALIVLSSYYTMHLHAAQKDNAYKLKVVEMRALPLMRKMLKDPLMPDAIRAATVKLEGYDSWSDAFKCALLTRRVASSTNQASLWVSKSNDLSIALFLTNDDVIENHKEPDWKSLQPKWDAFVNRYWPALRRTNSWDKALSSYAPGRGLFKLKYRADRQGIEIATLELEIRLADGRIGGLRLQDRTNEFMLDLKSAVIPPAPSHQRILQAIPKALLQAESSAVYQQKGVWIRTKKLQRLKIIERSRGYIRPKNKAGFDHAVSFVKVAGSSSDGSTFIFEATYDEKSNVATVTSNIAGPLSPKELKQISTPSTPQH